MLSLSLSLSLQPCHVVYTEYRPVPLQHYIYPSGADGLYLAVDEKVRGQTCLAGTKHLLVKCFNWFFTSPPSSASPLFSFLPSLLPSISSSSSLTLFLYFPLLLLCLFNFPPTSPFPSSSPLQGNFREDNFQTAMSTLQEGGGKGGGARGNKRGSSCFKVVKMIMERQLQPVIVFSFSRRDCETYALQMSKLDCNTGKGVQERRAELVKTALRSFLCVCVVLHLSPFSTFLSFLLPSPPSLFSTLFPLTFFPQPPLFHPPPPYPLLSPFLSHLLPPFPPPLPPPLSSSLPPFLPSSTALPPPSSSLS